MAEKKSIFTFNQYKPYLTQAFPRVGSGRGQRSKLAEHLGCQTTFISQVLNGEPHFSLEHAARIPDFLGLSADESHYFLLLVHEARAGSGELREYYHRQLQQARDRRKEISLRVQAQRELSISDQATYYGSWYYAAIHIALSIPELRTGAALARRLALPLALVTDSLDFLMRCGLAVADGNGYRIGDTRIHLAPGSPLLAKHHANWRVRTLMRLDEVAPTELHYSAVISLSKEDLAKIRAILLDAIEQSEPILRASLEEQLYCMAMDLFLV